MITKIIMDSFLIDDRERRGNLDIELLEIGAYALMESLRERRELATFRGEHGIWVIKITKTNLKEFPKRNF